METKRREEKGKGEVSPEGSLAVRASIILENV